MLTTKSNKRLKKPRTANPKSNKKTNSKFRKFLSIFDFSTKRGAMLTYAVAFAIVGGGYMAYSIFAATYYSYPPDSYALRYLRKINPTKVSDGKPGYLQCLSVYGDAGAYGKISHCIQFDNSSTVWARPGTYFYNTKTFYPNSSSFGKITEYLNQTTQVSPLTCGAYKFAGTSPIGAYGVVRYGYVFRLYNGKWQIKFAYFSYNSGLCTVWGNWTNAYYMPK
jgi:hypothetical protein